MNTDRVMKDLAKFSLYFVVPVLVISYLLSFFVNPNVVWFGKAFFVLMLYLIGVGFYMLLKTVFSLLYERWFK